jgi:indole-3-glycerol phosphate synthase
MSTPNDTSASKVDILGDICTMRRRRVAAQKIEIPFSEIDKSARAQPAPRGFRAALARKVAGGSYGLIAEIKKASPSAGLIRPDFDPAALARAYSLAGAACLSVLTEQDNFLGEDSHLQSARAAVDLPVLRKDFMLEPYQIAESRMIGADCVLLIMAVLGDAQAAELEAAAMDYGLDVLVEVHDEHELERALKLRSPLLGINNRNLKTLKTDLATTERLAQHVPEGRVMVAESGLSTAADLTRMARAGARCFLIGESLMRQADVEAATRALLSPASSSAHQSAG